MGIDFDPLGRFIAASRAKDESMLRLWPIPEGPPLLTLPREEFLKHLRSRTNLRIVPDAEAENGFKLDVEPISAEDALSEWIDD